jgi:hypothetical protein
VVLDGYDLGVGLLLHRASDAQKDQMISSIGPFWDANETWLVLGVGILLIAFPKAHGMVLTALYLPVALMLVGLILRGVAFDFRVKAQAAHKPLWNFAFFAGSGIAAICQGWMLGRYITGFASGWEFTVFAALIALLLPAAYVLLGAGWLIMKTEHELQRDAARGAGHGPDLAGHAVGQRDGAFALVHDAGIHRTAADPADDAGRSGGRTAGAQLQAGAGARLLAALRAGRVGLPARSHRPGLQPVPLRGDGQAHDLAGRQRTGVLGRDPGGLCCHGAGHRGLHGVCLPRVLGQGA